MGILNSYPVRFTPKGLSDSFDSSDTFYGACRNLSNFIFDEENPELIVPRPGVGSPLDSFGSFNTPTQLTVHIGIGNTIYGMVSTARNAGKDEPFAYVIGVGFTTITGVVAGNVPTSPITTGDWTPPTMDVIGTKIIVTHSGFSGVGANFFGVIDISNPAAPTWTSANTATNLLPSVPTFVSNFNNRAYFVCGNKLYYSDVLVPTTMTNASQSLTIGGPDILTGLSGLPVQTTSAGVVSALIVFKQFEIWQVTGDAAIANSLAINFMSLNIGCLSPRTIVQTPIGTIFIGIDGPYYVSSVGGVIPLTKDISKHVQDLQSPFQSIVNPGRAAAQFTGSIYRVCLDTISFGQSQTNDYWFDITSRRWTGPHTFNFDCASQYGSAFIISSKNYGAKLFQSQWFPTISSVYLDNGSTITCQLESSQFPKAENINQKQVVEGTVELGIGSSPPSYNISAIDDQRQTLNATTITTNGSFVVWGGGLPWGGVATYASSINSPKTYTIPWTAPIVFKKMAVTINVQAAQGVSIGTLFEKYQDTGYINA